MLSEQEKHDIRHEAAHYEDARAASIEALKIIQRARGWVPDEELAEAASLIGMSVEELDSVATSFLCQLIGSVFGQRRSATSGDDRKPVTRAGDPRFSG